MCLRLFVASPAPLRQLSAGDVRLSPVADGLPALTLPHAYEADVAGNCCCDLPYAMATEPIPFYDGVFESEDAEDTALRLSCVTDLLHLIDAALAHETAIEVFPTWYGEERLELVARIDWRRSELCADRFLFTTQCLYRITR